MPDARPELSIKTSQPVAAGSPVNEPLFRAEVIREMSVRHLDARSLQSPIRLLTTTIFLMALILGVLVLMANAPYARKHRVMGQLDETGTVALMATDFGHVSKINVEEGQTVVRGELLAKLSHREDERNGNVTELENRLAYLNKAVEKNSRSLGLKIDTVDQRRKRLSMQLSLTEKRLELQTRKVRDMQALLDKTAELRHEGHLSGLDWLNLQTNMATERQSRYNLQERLLDLQQDKKSLTNEVRSIELAHENTHIELGLEISRVREVLARTGAKPYQLLEANADGYISRIEVVEGGSIEPGQVIIYLTRNYETRNNDASTGTLLVPPVATRYLSEGDDINLELESFPRETFGTVRASIETIPQYTIMVGQQPVYPVRVSVNPSPTIDVYLPGMTIMGNIIVERKTIAQWLLSPLTEIAGKLT